MSIVQFILTTAAAIGSANAASSRLVDVMSVATGYNETQLHNNVTAYDVCMYLATGYQYNQMVNDTIISTEAYDDLDQGVAKILTRYVNGKYNDTIEALDTYNDTQRVVNFDVSECDGITDDEVIDWFFPSTVVATDYDEEFDWGRHKAKNNYDRSPGQKRLSSQGSLDVSMCSTYGASSGTSCGCAQYGSNAAACQTSHLRGGVCYTDQYRNWCKLTALMIGFQGIPGIVHKRLVGS